jgi:FkbH-like protein
MSDPIDLPWLPTVPADFRKQIGKVELGTQNLGNVLRQLASHNLDFVQTSSFNRLLNKLRAEKADLAPLQPFCLTLLSNATVDTVCDALPTAAARHGVALKVNLPELDQIVQQALDPNSMVNTAPCDALLLALDYRWYSFDQSSPDSPGRAERAIEQLAQVLDILESVKKRSIILQTVSVPPLPLFGSYDRTLVGTARDVDLLNQHIVELAKQRGHYILDVAALCETIGTARYHDLVAWNLYKIPSAQNAIPLYADWLGRLLGAIAGKSRKCLVLDLDNTLWGGVIGDDGLENIKIGKGNADGEAFLSVQQFALDLKNRGIILAVSSKNEDATARAAFIKHPEMLLRENDIAVFQANWVDKASNIESIAKTLNIGLDAIVFLDDNSAERAQVRAALPEVAVPEIGQDAAHYAATLAAAGYFESVAFSNEDRSRAASYKSNFQRAEVQAKARNLGDYLQSLAMRISHSTFDPIARSRISQLINKSNQFNLTTKRYSEAEVAAVESSAAHYTQQTRLTDQFGDFGMIGVVIAVKHQSTWDIDTWLMSCRVLGRKVEEAMFDKLVTEALKKNVGQISAQYIPTAKNMMVADHYDKLGFEQVERKQDGIVNYKFDLAKFVRPSLPFENAN